MTKESERPENAASSEGSSLSALAADLSGLVNPALALTPQASDALVSGVSVTPLRLAQRLEGGTVLSLLDSSGRGAIAPWLEFLSDERLREDPGLACAKACIADEYGRPDEAFNWFSIAWGNLRNAEPNVAARVAYEFAFFELNRSHRTAAEAIARSMRTEYGQGNDRYADLVLLDGLLADNAGDHALATLRYQASLAADCVAISPMSRVRALANLAVALEQRDPIECAALCDLARGALDAGHLDERMRPAIRNIRGYALIAVGRLSEAESALRVACDEANEQQATRTLLHAQFNLAIVQELAGQIHEAEDSLREIRVRARKAHFGELADWVTLRLAWLAFIRGDRNSCETLLVRDLDRISPPIRLAYTTLDCLRRIRSPNELDIQEELGALAVEHIMKDSVVDAFAIWLWSARVAWDRGQPALARQASARAHDLGRPRGLRLSQNWWTPEIVEAARAVDPGNAYWHLLHVPPQAERARIPGVTITEGGAISIDEQPLPFDAWRRGRAGAFVLRRLFRLLASAYPKSISMARLADSLWADSEGDVAIRNLYGAIADLRRVLVAVPGVRVSAQNHAYCLEIAANVRVLALPHEIP